jgi:hypothetical protein
MIQKGFLHAQKFTGEEIARKVMSVYLELAR